MAKHLKFLFMIKADPLEPVQSSIYMSFPQENIAPTKANFAHKAKAQLAAAAQYAARGVSVALPDLADPQEQQECLRKTHNIRQALYEQLLRHWLSHFDPSQFILISSESYFSDPWAVVQELAELLDLPHTHADSLINSINGQIKDPSLSNHNTRKPSIHDEDPSVVFELEHYFLMHKTRLAKFLMEYVVDNKKISFIGRLEPFLTPEFFPNKT